MADATIYVVTTGSYSDYGIRGLFSSKELAEEYIAAWTDPSEARVEDWVLDEMTGPMRDSRLIYYLQMNRDGECVRCEQEEMNDYSLRQTLTSPTLTRYSGGDKKLIGYVRAEHDRHAIKIMNEHRARLIAEGRWDQ